MVPCDCTLTAEATAIEPRGLTAISAAPGSGTETVELPVDPGNGPDDSGLGRLATGREQMQADAATREAEKKSATRRRADAVIRRKDQRIASLREPVRRVQTIGGRPPEEQKEISDELAAFYGGWERGLVRQKPLTGTKR